MNKPKWYWLSCVVIIVGAMGLFSSALTRNQAQSVSVLPLPSLQPVTVLPVAAQVAQEASVLASPSGSPIKPPVITAQAAYAIDLDSGAVLFEKAASTPLYPASTTKLMTALVARDQFNLDELVTISPSVEVTGTVLGLRAGEVLTVRELLKAALIQSANDAAMSLALHHPQGVSGFVTQMNQKAAALHLTKTHFDNPSGIDMTDQLASARDLALLAQEVMKDPVLSEIVGTKVDHIGVTSVHQLHNTHALLGKNGIIGIKTGTTELAGEVLITLAAAENHKILIVLMGSQNRYDETQALLHWLANNYTWYTTQSLTSYATR